MIAPAHVQLMARYNRWQNENLYTGADRLSDVERNRDAGAFFGSLHATSAHLLWGDMTWLRRFDPASLAAPALPAKGEFARLWPEWADLRQRRVAFDARIVAWSETVSEAWLAIDLTWTSSDGSRTTTKPTWVLVTHFFNHQTHHRGQVHCLLTQAGVRPGDTDLMLMRG